MYCFLSTLNGDLLRRITDIKQTENGIIFTFRYDIDDVNCLYYQITYEKYRDSSDWYRIDILDSTGCLFKEICELIEQYLIVLRNAFSNQRV